MEYFITFPAKLSVFFGSDMAGSHLQRAHRSAPEKTTLFYIWPDARFHALDLLRRDIGFVHITVNALGKVGQRRAEGKHRLGSHLWRYSMCTPASAQNLSRLKCGVKPCPIGSSAGDFCTLPPAGRPSACRPGQGRGQNSPQSHPVQWGTAGSAAPWQRQTPGS